MPADLERPPVLRTTVSRVALLAVGVVAAVLVYRRAASRIDDWFWATVLALAVPGLIGAGAWLLREGVRQRRDLRVLVARARGEPLRNGEWVAIAGVARAVGRPFEKTLSGQAALASTYRVLEKVRDARHRGRSSYSLHRRYSGWHMVPTVIEMDAIRVRLRGFPNLIGLEPSPHGASNVGGLEGRATPPPGPFRDARDAGLLAVPRDELHVDWLLGEPLPDSQIETKEWVLRNDERVCMCGRYESGALLPILPVLQVSRSTWDLQNRCSRLCGARAASTWGWVPPRSPLWPRSRRRSCSSRRAWPETKGEGRMTEVDRMRSRAQALMEWKPLIEIYESRWWRKSGLFALMTGTRFGREYEKIVGALELGGDELLLDLACGSGIYSRPLARLLGSGRVVGLDLSTPMLSYAAGRAKEQAIENLALVRASAMDLPFQGDAFDRVNCCGALHLFPDFSKATSEVLRVLRPGGIFTAAVFRNWLPGRVSRKLADFQYRRMGAKNFQPEELESLLVGTGFERFEFHHGKRYWQIVSAVKPG